MSTGDPKSLTTAQPLLRLLLKWDQPRTTIHIGKNAPTWAMQWWAQGSSAEEQSTHTTVHIHLKKIATLYQCTAFTDGKQNSAKIWCVGIRKIKLESALPPPNTLNRMSSALVYTALQEKTPGFLMLHYRTKCYSIPSVKYREITARPYVPECVHVPASPGLA